MKCNQLKAFSLLELITVISIILVVATLLYPVFAQAKVASKVAVTTTNLRQAYLAIQIYRNDWEETPFGSPAQMGLPSTPQAMRSLPPDILKSPCTGMNTPFGDSPNYHYIGIVDGEQDQEYVSSIVLKFLGTTPLLVDPNCNQGVDPNSSETTKRFIWVNLDGAVIKRMTKGTEVSWDFFSRT